MRQSRYVWILLIAIVCLGGILALQTPQVVMTSITDPGFSDAPQTAVLHFWRYLDNRQFDLASGLLLEPAAPPIKQEMVNWQEIVEKDPFLTLQKVEFANSGSNGILHTRIYWTAPAEKILTEMYDFELTKTTKGWKIKRFTKI